MFDFYFVAKHDRDIEKIKEQLLRIHDNNGLIHVISKNEKELISCQAEFIIEDVEPNKESSVYLDHAGNVSYHGFAEDIIPDLLDDETKEYNEKELTKDKPPAKEKECPQCAQIMMGLRCKCGYEIPITEQIETDNQELEVLHSVEAKNWNKKTAKKDKAEFYGMLKQYGIDMGYKPGWAAFKYRERSGVWPNAFKDSPRVKLDDSFMNYLKHLAMKRARAA